MLLEVEPVVEVEDDCSALEVLLVVLVAEEVVLLDGELVAEEFALLEVGLVVEVDVLADELLVVEELLEISLEDDCSVVHALEEAELEIPGLDEAALEALEGAELLLDNAVLLDNVEDIVELTAETDG